MASKRSIIIPSGPRITASGYGALNQDNIGSYNTADGVSALGSNITGSHNTASGLNALYRNNSGSYNIAVGDSAGFNLTTGSGNIDIGNEGVAGELGTIRIGTASQTNTYVAGISGAIIPTGIAVIVDANGHLGTTTCSVHYKENIQPMAESSEAIPALKPVTFRYKHDLDPQAIPQFGLVAEEGAKVAPELVAKDKEGRPYSVRYEAVNAMLLNEFLKEHRKNEEQQVMIEQQQKQINALTAGLQKVSAQLATGRVRPTASIPVGDSR
jgi:hypothetical protein